MHSKIYQPAEDSYLLKETLENYLCNITNKNIKILDMGSGSGIQAETCRELGFKNILTADINQDAVKSLKSKGFKAIHSDLFSNINKKEKFDLIIFNPPYLPENEFDKEADTTGGKRGYEVIKKFLEQAKYHLSKDSSILLLFSSLSKPNIIIKKAKELNYYLKLLNKKNLFFEELQVYILNNKYS